MGGVTPHRDLEWGNPPIQTWDGVPPIWDGVTLYRPDLGWGTTPPVGWMGYPPPPICEQTDTTPVKTVTFLVLRTRAAIKPWLHHYPSTTYRSRRTLPLRVSTVTTYPEQILKSPQQRSRIKYKLTAIECQHTILQKMVKDPRKAKKKFRRRGEPANAMYRYLQTDHCP